MHTPIDIGLWNDLTYNEYIHSEAWKARANEYKRKVGYRCEHPGCKVYNVVDVHHRSYLHLGAELDSELICLCRKHHREVEDAKISTENATQ